MPLVYRRPRILHSGSVHLTSTRKELRRLGLDPSALVRLYVAGFASRSMRGVLFLRLLATGLPRAIRELPLIPVPMLPQSRPEASLPEYFDGIAGDLGIAAQQGHLFQEGLGDEDAVEWVWIAEHPLRSATLRDAPGWPRRALVGVRLEAGRLCLTGVVLAAAQRREYRPEDAHAGHEQERRVKTGDKRHRRPL